MLRLGSRLGPYEILSVIGAGGMGEVYRGRDTNLQRDVAIKVLPAAMADNATRLLRFEREARALAALNHPNIATVYAIEDRAIVMELVDGEDLSVRLRRGPIPLAEALPILRQVADALAAAHDAGIVHRDLKPANIKVREDGTVKVLDFGLAKGGSADASADPVLSDPELAPTITLSSDATEDGAIVGTAAYMAPEQAKGKLVDKRADIWSFGVVAFEMLAGRRPFDRSGPADAADTIARVLATDPDWGALPPGTPSSIRRMLARCLSKERKQRLHDIADARFEIDDAASEPPARVQPSSRRWTRSLAPASLSLIVGVALGVALWRTPSATPLVTYAHVDARPATEVNSGGVDPSVVLTVAGARTALAWSPDGRTLAFIGVTNGVRQVFLRDLASNVARPLSGTEGAHVLTFSPTGDEIAFWAGDGLRRVRVAGGPPVKICDSGDVNGISWGATRIVFSEGSLSSADVSLANGVTKPVTFVRELVRHASPFLLPGDAAVLYTEYQKQWTSGDERVMVLSLAPGATPKLVLPNAADARYLPTGHLAFLRQGTLFVVPFDPVALELRGEPVAMLNDVAQSVAAWDSVDLTLAGQFAISPQGALAFISSATASYPDRELIVVERSGRIAPLGAPARRYRSHVQLSPDGRQLAVAIQTNTGIQLYAYDLLRGGLSRIAEQLKGELRVGSWSRDNQLAVQVVDGGKISAALVTPDVSAVAIPVPDTTGFWASSLTADGRLVGMYDGDLWVYATRDPAALRARVLATKAEEMQAEWSPDGRWLAFTTTTTGRREVYVKAYPDSGPAVMVSTNGGLSPVWNPAGGELFYIEPGDPQDRMMVVNVAVPAAPGRAAALFDLPRTGLFPGTAVMTTFTVSRDGRRFYGVRQPPPGAGVNQISLVLNWFEELKTKLPAVR